MCSDQIAMVSRFSMATARPYFSFEVFLSFRGEDTRKIFTDHLYKALKQAGIRTFRDDDAMERGKLLKPELQKAIQESAVSVIVFSKGYASSKWCLDEVMMIMEQHETSSSKHEVLPVFYKIDPSDVRNQRGCFKEAFDAFDDEINAETDVQKKRELSEKVEAWRGSLRKAATFTGMVLGDRYESEFIINIVNVVIKKVDRKALYVEDKLVGIEDRVAIIEEWLQDSSCDARALLIDGMGGIGKSTIAKIIYNSNFRNFDASCYLADINKETSNHPDGLRRLQSQLLSMILKSENKEIVWNVDEGTVKVTQAISNKKVLLILDDVTTSEQLESLLGSQSFYQGSKVMITTRHKELSTAFKVHPQVYSVEELSTRDALQLFSLYAFHEHQPIEPYIIQSELFVRHCMGLPLALRVLGSSLRGKTNDIWEDTIRKLVAIPDPKIQKVLQISYDTLEDDKDKDLLLHIACFFEGDKKDYIVTLLAECDLYPVVGIKNLQDRCLLYVDEYERVKMHQLIKDMGREVVRQESLNDPGKRSRLWHREDCFNVLKYHTGTKNVQGLMLDMQKTEEAESALAMKMNSPAGKRSFEDFVGKTMHGNDANFKNAALEKMKNLMLLQLNYVTLSGKGKKLPKKLRLLRWHGFSLKAIPVDICLEKLVVLDMSYSKLKCVWDDFKIIVSLKILNLSHSVELVETPDFGGFPGLESLILEGCSGLIKVHESIALLKGLVLLNLTGCRSLRDLPFLPSSLVSLQISRCPNLGVPERVQSLYSLSSSFFVLKEANFSFCNLFDESFSNDWSSLGSLEYLILDGNHMTFLPKCIQTLPRIEILSIGHCSKIQSILGLPKCLKTLIIPNNESLEQVPTAQDLIRTIMYYPNCPKLLDMELNLFKIRSIEKVERKIIRYLGLESNAAQGILEIGLQVLHEFGIFSTCVSEKQIPSACYMYEEKGPQISFKVHSHSDSSRRVIGFNMCAVISQSITCRKQIIAFFIYNKTKNLRWTYKIRERIIPKNVKKFAWLSIWRCHSLMEAGDEIVITHEPRHENNIIAEEFRINILYEDDEQVDGEREEAYHVNAFDQLLWNDKMSIDISDYVNSEKTLRVRHPANVTRSYLLSLKMFKRLMVLLQKMNE